MSRAFVRVVACTILLGAPARAQMKAMTLPEAVEYAKAHHPDIRAATARINAQKALADVPRAQWYPVFGASAQIFAATANNTTGTYVQESFMDIPRIGATRVVTSAQGPTFEPSASTFVGVGGIQELFDFGRIAVQAAAADALTEVEQQRSRTKVLDVTYTVEESYYAVLASKAIVKSAEDAYDRARVHRDLAKVGVDAGLRPPIELTRAEADLARFDIGRTKAKGNVTIAQTLLAGAIGIDEPAIDTASAPPALANEPALSDGLQQAASKDPRILQLQAAIKAEEEQTRAIGAELRPNLSLTATFSGRAGGAPPTNAPPSTEFGGWVPYVPNWDVGLVLSWPIWDGTVAARKSASRAREDVRREELALVKQQTTTAVRQAYVEVEVARTALPGLKRAVDAAIANYAQADARFKAGLGTSVELADAETIRTVAEYELAAGEFELARARANLGRAIAEGM